MDEVQPLTWELTKYDDTQIMEFMNLMRQNYINAIGLPPFDLGNIVDSSAYTASLNEQKLIAMLREMRRKR